MLRPAIVIGSRWAASGRPPPDLDAVRLEHAGEGRSALAFLEARAGAFGGRFRVADPHLDEPGWIAGHELAVDRREQGPGDPVRFGDNDRPSEPVPRVAGLHEHIERVARAGHLA